MFYYFGNGRKYFMVELELKKKFIAIWFNKSITFMLFG